MIENATPGSPEDAGFALLNADEHMKMIEDDSEPCTSCIIRGVAENYKDECEDECKNGIQSEAQRAAKIYCRHQKAIGKGKLENCGEGAERVRSLLPDVVVEDSCCEGSIQNESCEGKIRPFRVRVTESLSAGSDDHASDR